MQRKLAQLQLEVLTNINKKKTHAPVRDKDKEEAGESAVMAPVNAPPPHAVQ